MVLRHIAKMGAALLVAGALAIGAAPPASAHTSSSGNRSLASVLAKDGSGFDRNWNDFDIVDNAVHAVLKAKPNSAVRATLPSASTPTADPGLAVNTAVTALSTMSKSFQLRSKPAPSLARTVARLRVPVEEWLAGDRTTPLLIDAKVTRAEPSWWLEEAFRGH